MRKYSCNCTVTDDSCCFASKYSYVSAWFGKTRKTTRVSFVRAMRKITWEAGKSDLSKADNRRSLIKLYVAFRRVNWQMIASYVIKTFFGNWFPNGLNL